MRAVHAPPHNLDHRRQDRSPPPSRLLLLSPALVAGAAAALAPLLLLLLLPLAPSDASRRTCQRPLRQPLADAARTATATSAGRPMSRRPQGHPRSLQARQSSPAAPPLSLRRLSSLIGRAELASRTVDERVAGMNRIVSDALGGSWGSQAAVKGTTLLDGSVGLVLTRDIKKGEAIVSIDTAGPLCLTLDKVAQSGIGSDVDGMASWAQLAVYIIHQSRTGGGDTHSDSLSALNLAPDSPLLWTAGERQSLLKGTQALETAEQYLAYVRGEWRGSIAPRLSASADPTLQNITEEDILWAFCVVRANSFPPLDTEGGLALIGLAGVFQHSRADNAARLEHAKRPGLIAGLSAGMQGGGGGGGGRFVIRATGDLPEGSVASMDYAPGASESSVLASYGRADAAGALPAVELRLSVSEGDRFFGDKADALEQEGLPLASAFLLDARRDPPETMQAMLRLCLLKDKDAFILEPIFRDDLWSEHVRLPFSESNEEDVCNTMIDWASKRLAAFSSALDENKLVRDSGRIFPGSKEEKALGVCIAEQEALEQTVNYFRRRLASFEQIQFYQERRLMSLNLLTEDGRSTYDPFKDNIA
mmetsp:Transcript_7520/g.18276  ORF Transcript_7520/g.18276 Transcript_7520/m.18276 type:complete len:591 (-) Transcript_7520:248-2020(-)